MKLTQLLSGLFLMSILLIFSTGCYTTGVASKGDVGPAPTMYELLRRQPNLIVNGSGQNIALQIRGRSSVLSSNEPLIIMDGIRLGSGYDKIAHVNPSDVARIEVISDPAALASYGLGAANGVINIRLKKAGE